MNNLRLNLANQREHIKPTNWIMKNYQNSSNATPNLEYYQNDGKRNK